MERKLRTTDRQVRIASIKGLIAKYGMISDYDTNEKIYTVLGMSHTDYYMKLRTPEKWRLGELDALYHALHIPKEEFVAALFGG